MDKRKRLGDLLIEANLITQSDLEKALRLQVGGNRRLGYLLIKIGFITEEQLHTVLTQQLDLSIVSIDNEIKSEVKNLLPRYLCRKYSLIPLAFGENNTLKMAMVDPSDSEAVADIERYTNKIIQPVLASKSDITTSIRKHIPWSFKELFNNQTSNKMTALLAALALVLVIIVVIQLYKDRVQDKYGTVTRTPNTISYENLELILGFTSDNKVSLLGRGAYSSGYYSVTFNDPKNLNSFVESKKHDFSASQREWLSWAMSNPMGNKK